MSLSKLDGRLRAALLIIGLALCLPVLQPGVFTGLVSLAGGLGGLAYLCWRLSGTGEEGQIGGSADMVQGREDVLVSAGHDLRQPVQAISLFAASLAAYPLPESQRKLVSGIETGVLSLSGMFEAVFGLAKLRSGRIHCVNEAVELTDVFGQVVADKLDIAHEQHVHLRHAHTARKVNADPVLLQQALGLLLATVLSLPGKDGGVLFGNRRRGDEIWIELWSTAAVPSGSGLESRFVPGSSYCDGLPDKGYALAFAQGLAELMGGQLEAITWPQRGSVLRLRLRAA